MTDTDDTDDTEDVTLADLLTPPARVKLISEVVKSPDTMFTVEELARAAGLPRTTTHEHVETLLSAGVVTRPHSADEHITFNGFSPLANALFDAAEALPSDPDDVTITDSLNVREAVLTELRKQRDDGVSPETVITRVNDETDAGRFAVKATLMRLQERGMIYRTNDRWKVTDI